MFAAELAGPLLEDIHGTWHLRAKHGCDGVLNGVPRAGLLRVDRRVGCTDLLPLG